MAGIAVALSGGGHRAALFGLGVLLYLVDAKKNEQVTSIASVSGGSLTNAYVAQSIDYATASTADFEPVARRLAGQIVKRATLWAAPLTWLYLALLLATAAAAIISVWFLPLALVWRVLLFFVGLLLLAWVASWRGVVCARAFASTLFSADSGPTPLSSLHSVVDHVLCATDLHWGEHVYFSGRFVCAYRFGWGAPGDLLLADAVQASAAYPGGFPARSFPTSRHAFAQPGDERASEVRALALVDGGAYDNMGTTNCESRSCSALVAGRVVRRAAHYLTGAPVTPGNRSREARSRVGVRLRDDSWNRREIGQRCLDHRPEDQRPLRRAGVSVASY